MPGPTPPYGVCDSSSRRSKYKDIQNTRCLQMAVILANNINYHNEIQGPSIDTDDAVPPFGVTTFTRCSGLALTRQTDCGRPQPATDTYKHAATVLEAKRARDGNYDTCRLFYHTSINNSSKNQGSDTKKHKMTRQQQQYWPTPHHGHVGRGLKNLIRSSTCQLCSEAPSISSLATTGRNRKGGRTALMKENLPLCD